MRDPGRLLRVTLTGAAGLVILLGAQNRTLREERSELLERGSCCRPSCGDWTGSKRAQFYIERLNRGEYRLVRRAPSPNEGLVGWLLACPEKGYFRAIDGGWTDGL